MAADVIQNLGLSSQEAANRLKIYGENITEKEKKNKVLPILWSQFNNPLTIILIIVTAVSYFLGDKINSTVIGIMLLVNATVGFWQEYKAYKSIEKLKKLINFKSKVIRNGKSIEIDTRLLVPGDFVLLHKGDKIPADIKVYKSLSATVNEANLTGESVPVEKETGDGLFAGTLMESGYCEGEVIKTGKDTELGESVNHLGAEIPTAFEQGIRQFNKMLVVIVMALTTTEFIINSVIHHDILTSFILGVSLALGITPEIFPVIIMISVSSAAFALSRNKVVVKRLNVLEDIGNIDIICTDKTGTITNGKLVLNNFTDLKDQKDEDVLWWAMICNSHNPATGGHLFPNTLDKAIWSHKLGRKWSEKIAAIKVIKAVDFSFETRTMSVTVNNRGEELEVIKGQSEAIFSLCKLSKIEKEKAKLLVGSKEKKGLKVLAIATRSNKSGIKLRGFLTFEDKVRNDLKNVFSKLDKLNVSLKIITGDNMEITRSVCIQAGLEILGGRIIMGKEIEKANDSQLQETVKKYNIFAKTTPKDKQRIILAMRRNGHNVGYMGDGVNDVGALKSADVAIAVGNANDICKDVADIVLMRTDLDLIVKAVVMGRKVFANTTKFIANTMSSSFGNVISITISSVFLKFIPMLPSQVLLIDSLSDIQHLTIANDNVDVENLKKPNHWDVNKIGKFMVIFGLISTIFDLITMFTFSRFVWDPELFRSIWYIESNLTELLATFSIRTRRSMFGSKPGTGLIITSAAAILISFIAPYTKIGEELFGFQSVDFQYVIIVIAIVAVYIAILEYAKEYWYRNNG